ncbi:MAG: class I SAM-dependent methyltransferase [Bacteroidetes bacterium]|nr:class I SAM-dependent methyltransferase [Bacteroidota bacterium]
MNILGRIFGKYHDKWAWQRFNFFIENIKLNHGDTILDLGGGTGSYMDRFGSQLNNYNIIISDIDQNALRVAESKGYKIMRIDGSNQKLPFADKEIDCIFCNSVIEHVTIPKDKLWSEHSISEEFFNISFEYQKHFASEIKRCSKKYYVQTPHKYYPVEAHTWFPFVSYFNRRTQVKMVNLLNKFWVKKTNPDWNLLTEKEMKLLFPDAEIIVNKKLGFKKEIIAIYK